MQPTMSGKLKQNVVFNRSKPLLNIYSGLDHEGKEVEVREDAEQLMKWHEIEDALVSAGYYRAQIQGLSAFDKIVGGLTWCIELCDIDVDVSLLFEENLTIGKKIALTEKIVKVLKSIKCPYTLEPHQIQGLDFINILPLVQWLIKYSSEFRKAKESELRRFAVMQYENNYLFESDKEMFLKQEKLLKNLLHVENIYKPCRVRKRKGLLPTSVLEQVNSTLSEYDQRLILQPANNMTSSSEDDLEFLKDSEKTLADPSNLTKETQTFVAEKKLDADSLSDQKMHYELLKTELINDNQQDSEENIIKYSKEVDRLKELIEVIEKEMSESKLSNEEKMKNMKKQYASVVSKLQKLAKKVMKTEDCSYNDKDMKIFYKNLRLLAKEKSELLEIIKIKSEHNEKLQINVRAIENSKESSVETALSPEKLKEFYEREKKLNDFISELRISLSKLNQDISRYTRAIDDVPGPAELLQYEKRFIELYEQVASKHKETKQYYIFYNTLYEVKLYIAKELSLLNSILDNYEEAMSSTKKREEFMTQFQSIVEWVNQTVKKVETKYKEEKEKKALLHTEYSGLLEVQRQYAAALKNLASERRKVSA